MKSQNYEWLAEKGKRKFMDDPNISQANKDIVTDFLPDYHVAHATKQILFQSLRIFLAKTNDISKDMHDKETMNKVFREIYKEKPGYFETIRKAAKKFCKRINDDELPKAVKQALNKFKIEENKRDLATKSLLLWEDGLKMVAATNSVQLKCIIALQLDCGLRPSEVVNLDYGDIERKNDFIVVKVREGKTGKRDVVCWRCVPFVLKWLMAHPSQKDNAPLWIQEHNNEGKIKRYTYPAMLKQIKGIARLSKIEKNVDFYALRHSSCFLDKLENIPLDVAADRHGHSVKYLTKIDGKLDSDAVIKRIRKHKGMSKKEEEEAERNITCTKCQFINPPKIDFCEQCNSPLTMKKALELEDKRNKEMQQFVLEAVRTEIERNPKAIS